MKTVELVKYSDKYSQDLERLLKEFSTETFGYGTASLQDFLNFHWVVYLATKDNEVIGFASYTFNTYFGMRPPTIGMTYLYVQPPHRNTKASYMLCIQAGKLSTDNMLPLEHYYASKESEKIGRKMVGTKLYTAYQYPVEEVNKLYSHLIKRVRIKND